MLFGVKHSFTKVNFWLFLFLHFILLLLFLFFFLFFFCISHMAHWLALSPNSSFYIISLKRNLCSNITHLELMYFKKQCFSFERHMSSRVVIKSRGPGIFPGY